jgi:Transposase DDE domain
LASVGVVAIDGTKIVASASLDANRDFGQIAREILAEAAEIDRREDELYGSERGDELPEHLRTREGRRRALREAKERLDRERTRLPEASVDDDAPVTVELDPREFVTRPEGRRAWVREGRRALESQRERERRPIAKDRTDRLFEACRRLEEELDVEHASHDAYEAWRARGIAADGSRRMAAGMVKPHEPVLVPGGTVDTTDHDSRVMRAQGQPPLQGYNAQLAVNDQQVIVAAEVTPTRPTSAIWSRWSARRSASCAPLTSTSPRSWSPTPVTGTSARSKRLSATASRSSSPPDSGLRTAPRPGWTGGLYDFMRRVLATPAGRAAYRTRQATIEPVFGQRKFNRQIRRFQRRGRAACRSEWRPIAATHNLLKLHNHRLSAVTA